MPLVTGVDGCKGGWLAISRDTASGVLSHAVHRDAASLLAAVAESVAVVIDIPIGLAERGPRECDGAARRLLAGPRAASVFPAPIRPALGAVDRAEADRITRALDGRGVGAQAWHLYARIRDVDRLLRGSPIWRPRVWEGHPEVCFQAMDGGRAMAQRRRLVARDFGADELQRVRAAHGKGRVADDDILDAFALCWTARRVAAGEAVSLPDPAPCDAYGLRMGIVY